MTELVCTEPGYALSWGLLFRFYRRTALNGKSCWGMNTAGSTNAAGVLQVGKHLQNLSAKTSKNNK